MSTIRFVHTDHLRLGTPLSGIAHPPTWLQQLASASVRQAVRNVLETAVAQRAHFLLIAGSICDSSEDAASAARWLTEQLAVVRREGIRIVTVADDRHPNSALGSTSDIVLKRGEALYGTATADGSVQLVKADHSPTSQAGLIVTVGQPHVTSGTIGLTYNAIPALQPDVNSERSSHNGWLSQSAGAVQSISSSETGNRGCLVVDADLVTGKLTSQFAVTNPIRFASEHLDLVNTTTADQLVADVTTASRSLQRTTEQTVVVDWIINLRLTGDLRERLHLDEASLLHRLRNQLESGHQGVWPRRIQMADQAAVAVHADTVTAEQVYMDLVTTADGGYERIERGQTHGNRHEELVTGLQLLQRVT